MFILCIILAVAAGLSIPAAVRHDRQLAADLAALAAEAEADR